MKKLYSVKEIAELLNKELEQQGADYRYTEELQGTDLASAAANRHADQT